MISNVSTTINPFKEMKINGYSLTRQWFDLCRIRTDLKPAHTALFLLIVDNFNMLRWPSKMRLPTYETMETLGIGAHKTYKNTLIQLELLGVIEVVQFARNQYQATQIILGNFDYAEEADIKLNATIITSALNKSAKQNGECRDIALNKSANQCHGTSQKSQSALNKSANQCHHNKTIENISILRKHKKTLKQEDFPKNEKIKIGWKTHFKKIWLEEFPDYVWTSHDTGAADRIKIFIKEYCEGRKKQMGAGTWHVHEPEILDFWEIVVKNLPKWERQNQCSITSIARDPNRIIQKIENGKNANTTTHDEYKKGIAEILQRQKEYQQARQAQA